MTMRLPQASPCVAACVLSFLPPDPSPGGPAAAAYQSGGAQMVASRVSMHLQLGGGRNHALAWAVPHLGHVCILA